MADRILLIGILLVLIGCGGRSHEPASPSSALQQRVDALLSQMSLDEKIEQMAGATDPLDLFEIMARHEPWPTPDNDRLGIPGLRFIDGPRGIRTCFPVAMARGAAWDPGLEERIGEAMGKEALAVGANVINAPCINLLRHPGWGRAQETYGEDPVHIGTMGVSFINGVQRFVMADVKHYALNSIEENRFLVDAVADERTLREVYLPHFRRCVQEGYAAAVMCAYNKVNGQYCCQNTHLLKDILKGEWDFDGFVVSDWILAVHETAASLRAGLDVEMPSPIFYGLLLKIQTATGKISEKLIDDAVRRILRQKIRFGLLDDPQPPAPPVDPDAHTALALEAAQEGIVLLKNVGDILPLARERVPRLAVIGRFGNTARLGDEGSSKVVPEMAISPFEGISNRAGSSVQVRFNNGKNIESAKRLARDSDATIVVAALTPWDEGEWMFLIGGDRESLRLHSDDERLIRAIARVTDRCIVVVEAGSAVSMDPWLDDVEAVIMAWYPGEQGGNAIGDVLFGEVNPSGKLPVTFPGSSDPLYPFGTGQPSASYGYYHGYRYYDRHGLDPLFPFGFGLSYTEYTYENLSLSPERIPSNGQATLSVDVTNTGVRAGEEVVQVYVGAQDPAVDRPVKELKAFTRAHLEPGETKRVSFVLKATDLATYDPAAATWHIETGAYTVFVGASSRDIRLTGSLHVLPSVR